MESNAPDEKQSPPVSRLTIDHGTTATPGLRFIYTGKSGIFSLSELLMLLVGIIFVGISLAGVFGSESYRWEGLVLLLVAAVFFDRFRGMRKDSGRLETLRYSVLVDDGIVCFSDGYEQKTFDLSKIGRLYIATTTKNGTLTAASISAYYNGDTVPVLNIRELYPRLGDQSHVVLEHIVDYLNSFASEAHKRQKPKQDASRFVPIQSGWRDDYAAETPIAARNSKPLAGRGKRLTAAIALGLAAYLIYQSPLFSIEQDYYLALVTLFAMFGLPILYTKAMDIVSACPCRKGVALLCSFAIICFSMALSYILYVHVEKGGAPLSPYIIATIFIPPVVWLIYHTISGCSCGARKVEQSKSDRQKRKNI